MKFACHGSHRFQKFVRLPRVAFPAFIFLFACANQQPTAPSVNMSRLLSEHVFDTTNVWVYGYEYEIDDQQYMSHLNGIDSVTVGAVNNHAGVIDYSITHRIHAQFSTGAASLDTFIKVNVAQRMIGDSLIDTIKDYDICIGAPPFHFLLHTKFGVKDTPGTDTMTYEGETHYFMSYKTIRGYYSTTENFLYVSDIGTVFTGTTIVFGMGHLRKGSWKLLQFNGRPVTIDSIPRFTN